MRPSRPQTIKQAKASYKSRNTPTLSEREKKQLERSIELDRRACRAKESEKRKVEAAKKRAEKERKEREERDKRQMGSQRRCDRFGFRGSQMHLGAFVKRAKEIEEDQAKNGVSQYERPISHVLAPLNADELDDDEMDFYNAYLDDEEALEAQKVCPEHMRLKSFLKQPTGSEYEERDVRYMSKDEVDALQHQVREKNRFWSAVAATGSRYMRDNSVACMEAMSHYHSVQFGRRDPYDIVEEKRLREAEKKLKAAASKKNTFVSVKKSELESLWDGLDSSSQIARELAADAPVVEQKPHLCASEDSYDSDDFDLTVEDIEELEKDDFDLTAEDIEDLENKPPLNLVNAERDRKLMPPPALPSKKTVSGDSVRLTRPGLPPPLVHGFTMTELESFVDDDLQLTQVDPG